jgi:hypothetical protein
MNGARLVFRNGAGGADGTDAVRRALSTASETRLISCIQAVAEKTMANTRESNNGAIPKRVRKSLGVVREDFSALSDDVGELASSVGEEAQRRLLHSAAGARHSAKEAVSDLQARVRAQPGLALGLAAGTGVLLGLLLAVRRS